MRQRVLGDSLTCFKPSQHSSTPGPVLPSSFCSGAVYGQQRITLLLGVSPYTCPAKLYDTRLNMCVLVCMLDLLFCSTMQTSHLPADSCAGIRGNGEIFPSNIESSDISCSQFLHPMEKPSALRGKASFFFPQKHTHFINEFSWLTKCQCQ